MSLSAIDLDTELMLRVQRDDSQSFGELLKRNQGAVTQYLNRMVHNQAIAEELAQDVFVRIYRSRHRWEPSARFTTWLYRITTNVALNHFRGERRHAATVSIESPGSGQTRDCTPLIEEQLVRQSAARKVRTAVQGLPHRQRAAVIMHKYEELDYAQIAGVLGLTPKAVKALMFRAYETLRERLR